jgi:GNAT superfamily N-acetyltransferase
MDSEPSARARIRVYPAKEADLPLILSLIRDLAEYERLSHLVTATEEKLRETLFEGSPAAEVLLASYDDLPVGYALFFTTYSTFLAKPGIYIEDLYVQQSYRGKGVGRTLFQSIAEIVSAREFGRLEWSVLSWNTPAIQFYRSLGAEPLSEWTVFRLAGAPAGKK